MDVEQSAAGTAEPDVASVLRSARVKPLELTDREKQILDLWDQAEELQLERSLLEAQTSAQPSALQPPSGDSIHEQLTVAEQEVLEARARYTLRQTIIRNVLLVDPILKAVHGGTRAHALEERLLPYINERDVLAMLHSTVAHQLSSTRSELSKAEQNHLTVNQKNQELAEMILELAEQLKDEDAADIEDPALAAELQTVEKEMRAARRKWRVMKGIAAAMVVGSGVDWASDGQLMDLVLDDEDSLG